jgi:DNA-binding CsgD family transcriptional regulator
MRQVDPDQLEKASRRLGDAVVDPSLWPEVMEEISRAVGATGAALLQSDVRTADVPRTAGIDELFRAYFGDNWHTRDLRTRGVPALLRGEGIITDQHCVTPDEVRREAFYNEFLLPLGFQWFAGVGFWAGAALWALSIQRTVREGPFTSEDQRLLAELSPRLTEAATLSTAVGRSVLSGMTNTLSLVRRPALALDRMGCVLDCNAAADRLFDSEIRVANRQLRIRDHKARAALDRLIDRMRVTADTASLPTGPPIVVQREGKRPVVIRALPISGAARSPFLGARALLTFADLGPKPGPDPRLLVSAFGLTGAEAKLASLIAQGTALDEVARALGVARETARNQLKAVFAKTETHRQGELVALLSTLEAGSGG